jgi:hypothetical protein
LLPFPSLVGPGPWATTRRRRGHLDPGRALTSSSSAPEETSPSSRALLAGVGEGAAALGFCAAAAATAPPEKEAGGGGPDISGAVEARVFEEEGGRRARRSRVASRSARPSLREGREGKQNASFGDTGGRGEEKLTCGTHLGRAVDGEVGARDSRRGERAPVLFRVLADGRLRPLGLSSGRQDRPASESSFFLHGEGFML